MLSGTNISPAIMAIRTIGMFMKNTDPPKKYSRRMPPVTGPSPIPISALVAISCELDSAYAAKKLDRRKIISPT